ncbi:MAG: hypothetical protein ABI398_00180 [Devosia sp.]
MDKPRIPHRHDLPHAATDEFSASSPKTGSAVTVPSTEIERLQQQTEEIERARALISGTINTSETIAQRAGRRSRDQIKLMRDQAKDRLAIIGSLISAAEAVGFNNCPLGRVALCGALDDLLKRSFDPAQASAFEFKGQKILNARRRTRASGLRCHLTAEHFGAEVKGKAKELGLKLTEFPGLAYSGRVPLMALLALGVEFALTVKVEFEDKALSLVVAGVVDESIRDRIQSAEIGTNSSEVP